MAPTPFGRYELRACLGSGGMGTVHLAFDNELRREVAIKRIRPELMASPTARARFQREAQAVSRLNHPGLCRVFDIGEREGCPYFVMPFVEGQTLADTLQPTAAARTPAASTRSSRERITWAVTTIEKVARALHHAHEVGLVHRDLNPRNIMIKEDGDPVILDFGLVQDELQQATSLTRTGQRLGTMDYASPEQVEARRKTDRRTDVYSLGVTLYECLTGTRPFTGDSEQLPRRILTQPTPNPRRQNPSISRDLAVVIEVAMDKETGRRYRTALDLAEDLRRVGAQQPIHARRTGLPSRMRRWVARNRTATAMLAALSVSTIVSVSLWRENSTLAARNADLADSEKEQRQVAEARAALARKRLDDFDRLAAVVRLQEAERLEKELVPAWPGIAPELESWLSAYDEPLREELARAHETLAVLRARGRTPTEAEREDRGLEGGSGRPRFADDADRFLASVVSTLAQDLEEFVGESGAVRDVRRRLAWARQIADLTENHPRARVTWKQAAAAIAVADGTVASALYRARQIRLEPQPGLVPIGMNPATGLWEFYHLRSAFDPRRGESAREVAIPHHAEDGSIQVGPGTGIVFVLLPGGLNVIGSQAEDPKGIHYDPQADDGEAVLTGFLDAFFLARYEMTQGQWMRLALSETPASYPAGQRRAGRLMTAAHPVETVSWHACDRLLSRYGLRLPSGWEWEYGCRAGTNTPWSCGTTAAQLEGFANGLDPSTLRLGFWSGVPLEFEDGHIIHAPVGSFAPNAFGLHDVHGNVAEWCHTRHRPGIANRVERGGHFTSKSPRQLRSAYRSHNNPGVRTHTAGLRPARSLR